MLLTRSFKSDFQISNKDNWEYRAPSFEIWSPGWGDDIKGKSQLRCIQFELPANSVDTRNVQYGFENKAKIVLGFESISLKYTVLKKWLRELCSIKGTLESSTTSSFDSRGNNSLGHTTYDKVACYVGGPSWTTAPDSHMLVQSLPSWIYDSS